MGFPFISSFFFILCFSIFFCLSSSNWFGVWLGLELNMLSFIVLVMVEKSSSAGEGAIKYFLLQALGSGLFFLGFSLSYMMSGSWGVFIQLDPQSILIFMGLGIKLGVAPFHFWVPSVMSALSWESALILSTAQKIGPLFFLLYLSSFSLSEALCLAGGLSVMIGGAGGLNQTQVRPLLGYSSISHMGWMLSIGLLSLFYSIFYFAIYLLSSIIIFWFLMSVNTNSIKNFHFSNSADKNYSPTFYLILLSLGGLPPLLGFFPKMMAFNLLAESNFYLILAVLITGSLMSLFYYLSLFFNCFLTSKILCKQSENFMSFEHSPLLSGLLGGVLLSGLLLLEAVY